MMVNMISIFCCKWAGAAQGAQFCLWPDPMVGFSASSIPDALSPPGCFQDVNGQKNERNCGPPKHSKKHKTNLQHPHTLLMREVRGLDDLGPIFWANTDNKVRGTDAFASKTAFLPLTLTFTLISSIPPLSL